MDWTKVVPVVLSILSFFGVSYLFQSWWADRRAAKKQKTDEAKAKAKRERQEEIREVFDEAINPLLKRIESVEQRLLDMGQSLDKDREATLASLRNQILQAYYACTKKGFKTPDDAENFRYMKDAYHKLNGNSFIDEDVIKWFGELPLKEKTKGEQ